MGRVRFTQPDDLVGALGISFSDQQLAAITAPLTPGVIIAGAGSGKTTVMAARVVWLVGSGQVTPDQVLGLTFTRKAAAELSSRVRHALSRAGVLAGDGSDGEELVLTYDAYAGRLVSEYGLLLGIEGSSRMITGAARYRLAWKVVADAAGPFGSLSRLRPQTVTDRLLELDGQLRSHLVDAEDLARHAEAFATALAGAPRTNRGAEYAAVAAARAALLERLELGRLVTDYAALKAGSGYVEYADQMAWAARLGREVPAVGYSQRDRFAVVLLDEYQDTSSAQAVMLRGLFSGESAEHGRGHPVTAVGDPCQAIYGWRGAAASNILEFASDFPRVDGTPAERFTLTVNRRSGQNILDAANRLAASVRADPSLAGYGLDLDLVAPAGTPPGRVEVSGFATWPEEVAALAERVAALHASGEVRAWSDIAVLTRRNAHLADVYAALTARDIPAEIVGLGGLLELPEVADIVATLRVIDDVSANASLVRLLTSARWAIGLPDLALLGRRARELRGVPAERPEDPEARLGRILAGVGTEATLSLAEAVDDPGDLPYTSAAVARFAEFGRELAQLRGHAAEPVVDLVTRVIDTLGLEVELASTGTGRPAQLGAFLQAVAAYTDIDGEASLGGLLAYLRAEQEHGVGLEQATISAADSVKLLTVHKAKGLEWEVVFVPGLAADVFPTDRVTGNWLKNAAVLPSVLRGDAASVPQVQAVTNEGFTRYAASLTADQRLAEDRLAYVAVTRARHLLLASSHVWAPGLSRPRRPSDYLVALRASAQQVSDADPVPETNPLAGPPQAAAWPAVADSEQLAARREAAALVASARLARAETGRYPEVSPADADDAVTIAAWDRWIAELTAEATGPFGPPVMPPHLSVTGVAAGARDAGAWVRDQARPLPRLVSPSQRDGTTFHRWVQARLASGRTPLLDDDDDDLAGTDSADLRALQRAFERGRFGAAHAVAVEEPFTLVLSGRLVRGRIDAVFAGTGDHDFLVVDWKTGPADRADPLQLALYRLAWAELHELPVGRVDAGFYDVRTDRLIRPGVLPGRFELDRLVADLGASLGW